MIRVLIALGAAGLGVLAYWAIGFGLHFGGVGLIYPDPALEALVWEWSIRSPDGCGRGPSSVLPIPEADDRAHDERVDGFGTTA